MPSQIEQGSIGGFQGCPPCVSCRRRKEASKITAKRALLTSALIITSLFAFGWQKRSKEQVLGWLTSSTGFEENLGQVSDFEGKPVSRVYSRIDLKDFALFITDKGASFVIYKREKRKDAVPLREEALIQERGAAMLHYACIDLEILNGKIEKKNISYEDEPPGYTHYYLPVCPDGMLYLKRYQKLRIRETYPGIDWVFKIVDAKVHHEFEIEPGADISRLKIKVKWADIEIEKDGKRMVLRTPLASVVDGELVAYELKEPEDLVPVKASYQKEDGNIIGFKVLGYSGFKDKLVLRLLAAPKEPIEVRLYNAIGERVLEEVYPADYSITISGKGIQRLPKGIYFLIVKSGTKDLGRVKLIKM